MKRDYNFVRPPAKLFLNNQWSERAERGVEGYLHFQRQKFKWGFLYKFFTFKNLRVQGVVPDYDTVVKFSPQIHEEDYSDADFLDPEEELKRYDLLRRHNSNFSKGDKVKVVSGELKNVKGHVLEIIGQYAKIKPLEKFKIAFDLQLECKQLAKDFDHGDNIVVVSGKYTGERGIVTHIDGEMAYFLSDIQKREFKVFLNDLKLKSQVAESFSMSIEHNYRVYDLVLYQNNKAGVVIGVERDTVKVVNEQNEVELIRVSDIQSKFS